MSYADRVFVDMCKDILENGTWTYGEKVRPVWTDTGEKAYTIKKFGVVNTYDLSKEFPAITLRKVPIKSCTDELLWIWQKKSNKVSDLSSHIWDSWVDKDGTIGKAYGYQLSRLYTFKDITLEGLKKAYPYGEIRTPSDLDIWPASWDYMYSYKGKEAYHYKNTDTWKMDQVDKVLYDLRITPYSRRIMTNMYAFDDLSEMQLYPCAYSMTFNVTNDKEGNKILNGILNQRSQDVLAANAWNVCQYAVLLYIIARDVHMKVGKLVHVIADAHIYDRHIPIIEDIIIRKQYDAPEFYMNEMVTDFYSMSKEYVRLDGYHYGEQVKNIPIAV